MMVLPRAKVGCWQWLTTLGLSALLFVTGGANLAASKSQQSVQQLNGFVEQAIAKAEGSGRSSLATL